MRAPRRIPFAGWLPLLMLVAGCGSSSTTVTSPATADRCAITLNGGAASVPAAGGSGSVGVSATRECTWSATVDGAWLSIRSGASGQGEGRVEFAAAPNPDPQTRTGAILVNGSRAPITQAAGECAFTLASASADFPPAGGAAQVDVRASSALCAWAAAADVPWIAIASGATGRGNGSVGIVVAATTGPPRTGSVTIAGQQFSVTQSQGCTYTIDRTTHSASAAGGSGTISVATAAACPWTAATNASWITVTPATSVGPGAVTFTVAATGGPQRVGTAVVAGHVFTVTQSPGCAYDVQPASHTVGAAGGTVTITIGTSPGCGWSAASNDSWIAVQGAATGNGPGQVTFSVGATTGPARTGTVTVGGRQITVTQTQGCSFAITPQTQSVPAAGGSGKVTVTAGAGCAWTAKSNASWVTVTSGASGSGPGEVQFSVAATTGPARSATLTIAGHTFTVTQGQGCTATLSPARIDIDNAGGQRSFDVQTAAGCPWTAATSTEWIALTSGTSGSGTGTVRFTIAPNSEPSRVGTIIAAGQTFTVVQGTGCRITLSQDRMEVPASGGTGAVNVTAGGGCGWAAESTAQPWLTVTSGANGTGNGVVNFSVARNDGADRTGTIVIGGQTFTVTQPGAPCMYTITPTQASIEAGGGELEVEVAAAGGRCSWQAKSDAGWIRITTGETGNGNGKVRLAVEANGGPARSGTVVIAGQTFTVNQASGCAFTVAPETIDGVASGGATARVDVTAPATCAWTAVANAEWITIAQPSGGSGNGAVDLTIAPNGGTDPRSGTVTIADRTISITQQGAAPPQPCVVTLTPSSQVVPLTGGTGAFAVGAAEGCAWTATTSDTWITITAGASGSGNGTVEFSVAPAPGPAPAPRTGTIVVNGRTFTITQQ